MRALVRQLMCCSILFSQVLIKGVLASGYNGDIAIDDIKFSNLACAYSPYEANPTPSTAPPPTTFASTIGPTFGEYTSILVNLC